MKFLTLFYFFMLKMNNYHCICVFMSNYLFVNNVCLGKKVNCFYNEFLQNIDVNIREFVNVKARFTSFIFAKIF